MLDNMNSNFRISLTGDLGSGKSTVGEILSERMGVQKITLGSIQRAMAEKMNMTTVELNKFMEGKPEYDKVFDDKQKALEDKDGGFILDSRLGFFFVPSTFSFYLKTDIYESARRIMRAERESERYDSIDEAVAKINERRESERKRFMDFYGVDILDMNNYDCIIDTTEKTPEEVACEMINAYHERNTGK